MSLTLTVLSFKNQPINEVNTVSIGNDGGSIGRSGDNTLVLPDTEKFVSRHHATISEENGCYYVTDTSLSGITINGQDVLHNATERLDDGTRLRIGEYEITVAITTESVRDDFSDFSFAAIEPTSIPPISTDFLAVDEPWVELESSGFNSLMTDNFPRHDELIQQDDNAHPADFLSHLQGNQSPLFDNYIAPSIISSSLTTPSVEQIPEDFNFDDFFSASSHEPQPTPLPVNKPVVNNDFEDFFDAAISDMAAERKQSALISEELPAEHDDLADFFVNEEPVIAPISSLEEPTIELTSSFDEPVIEPISSLFASTDQPTVTPVKIDAPYKKEESNINTVEPVVAQSVNSQVNKTSVTDSQLFDAFLRGAAVECREIRPEQQAETLLRIGQMFRKLIDGTIAVLRSRAEFKSLCRVNMTVIKAANNNPLKFTVSTDDVLRQLLENKTDGFLASTVAIEEAFTDIMNHQLAMQAGIQASLTDLLRTFDPKIIEKQFEQGLVLQKKSKCWDKYEETYRNTVEDAVDNFFGEEFVKAYEKQMSLLTNSRRN
jgi:type VI secretion system FHA domain protein